MPISVSCPTCEKKLKVEQELAGKRVKCPGCKQVLLIPAPGSVLDSGPPPNRAESKRANPKELKPTPERNRTVPALCWSALKVDRYVLFGSCGVSILLGALMTTGVLKIYRNIDDQEVGLILLALPIPACVLGFFFHRLIRAANGYYVTLAIYYLPSAFPVYAWSGMMLASALLGVDSYGNPPGIAGLLVGLAAVGYVATMTVLCVATARADLRTHSIPQGIVSFSLGTVALVIGVAVGLVGFVVFFTSSPQEPYLRNFLLAMLIAGTFSAVATWLVMKRGQRLFGQAESAAMTIAIECPNAACKKRLTAKHELAGKLVKCPSCGERIQVPSTGRPACAPAASTDALPQDVSKSQVVTNSPCSGASRVAWRYILPSAAVLIELILIAIALFQTSPEPLGVTDIVRTMALVQNTQGDKFVPTDEVNNCVLHMRVTGAFARATDNAESKIRLEFAGDSRTPSTTRSSTSGAPFGFSVSRTWLGFIVPKSQSDYTLVLGTEGSIPFKATGRIREEYNAPRDVGFPLVILAVVFPFLCIGAYATVRVLIIVRSRVAIAFGRVG